MSCPPVLLDNGGGSRAVTLTVNDIDDDGMSVME